MSAAKEPKDMSGTARCLDCGADAVHERGPGSPLVIRHTDSCPSKPSEPADDWTDAECRYGR